MKEEIKINFIDTPEIHENVKINNLEVLKRDFDNFKPEEPSRLNQPKKCRKSSWKKLLASIMVVFLITFAVFASSVAFSNENLIKNLTKLNFLSQIGSLITSGERPLQGEAEDRVNFVLIGIGGRNHDGGTLADTIILATLKPSTKQLAMISIPRDLYVKQNSSWMKVNAVSAYAEQKTKGSGPEELRSFLSNLLGTNIHYYAEVDFDGFENLIDEFGGVDVVVDHDLIDYQYPIRGREEAYPLDSRWETLVIKKGEHHFDGATALKYARSRHALGAEGSDFSRSKRQQKIILALKDKIIAPGTFFNPQKINALLKTYNDNVSTNLEVWEILKLLNMSKEIDFNNPIAYSLADGPTPMLYDQMIGGAYVLLPYGGNFDKISFVWQNIFTVGTSTMSIDKTKWAEFKDVTTTPKTVTTTGATTTKPTIIIKNTIDDEPFANENNNTSNNNPVITKATIEIQNGTFVTGWASQEKSKLVNQGFNVIKTGNAALRNYTAIKIYDFSGGKFSSDLSELKSLYGVGVSTPPAGLKSTGDILIILGQ